ncbi:hypothetical protein [Xylocopilactobacillus apis]|uniref:Uncharacterized protein n=1 Tax=Xylocopilactobacillus apis TaxID=2932183 RepID=A0AAU9DML8_9LACO|nr:hypothetical protein [Xylocopilactobacillus apis]BDR56899.1 hypothetical protein KIMC2_14610 [Xylocopilactobacillus apis]
MLAKFYDPKQAKAFCEKYTKNPSCEKVQLFMEKDEFWNREDIWTREDGYLIDLDQEYIKIAGIPGSIWDTPCIRACAKELDVSSTCYKEVEVGEE